MDQLNGIIDGLDKDKKTLEDRIREKEKVTYSDIINFYRKLIC